jgi:hypothetical protein
MYLKGALGSKVMHAFCTHVRLLAFFQYTSRKKRLTNIQFFFCSRLNLETKSSNFRDFGWSTGEGTDEDVSV